MAREEKTLEARIADLELEVERLTRRGRSEEARLDENLRRFGIRGTRGAARLDRNGLQLRQGGNYSQEDAGMITWLPEFAADVNNTPAVPGAVMFSIIDLSGTDTVTSYFTYAMDMQEYMNELTLTSSATGGFEQFVEIAAAAIDVAWTARTANGNQSKISMVAGSGSNAIQILTDTLTFQGSWHVDTDSVLSPTQLTGNVNNYAPTGHLTALVMRLSSDASRDITGIANGTVASRVLYLVNVGAQNIVLKDESASSTEANRFALKGDITIAPDGGVHLIYDNTTDRWRCVGTY